MRITANQVTFVRLLLLPVPVAMFYQGGTFWLLSALLVFTLLGLTDAVDGILARRYGSTPLGALLDPIVDKIFLVASYGPLADLQIVPMTFVALVFARELAVTALRSVALEERVEMRTSRIAKLKTTVQMAGAGFLLLVWLFPGERVILSILGVFAAGSLLPVVASIVRGRVPGWKAVSGAVLISLVFVGRLVMPPEATITGLMGAILAVTAISGLEYFWRMRSVLAARISRTPVEGIRLFGLSVAIPGLLLPALELPSAPTFLIFGVLAAELAIGGLDNSLVQRGVVRGPWLDLGRSGVQGAVGLVMLLFLPGAIVFLQFSLLVWLALFVTLSDLIVRFFTNTDVFRG